MSQRFALSSRPHTRPESALVGDKWRISILLDGLLRLEWDEGGEFEDRASTFAVHRDLPTPAFRVRESESQLEVLTERFHLTWDRQPFSSAGLSVKARGRVSDHRSTWRYGTTPHTLGGTGRTLDDANGPIPLEPGVVSRDGIAIVDDSDSFLFTEDGWIASRRPGGVDIYVFAYGHDYPAAIRAFYTVSGAQPVLPRWALGNWWSRYHAYSDVEYLELFDQFDAEGVPFSVAVLDMDWHRVASVPEQYGTGWTGYSWERSLFPDPERFLAKLHERGLRVTLNVHPHEGVQPFEDVYRDMCATLGRDPDEDLAVPFDITDRRFVEAYFDVVHHRLEAQGVDFWWIDWQQGHLSNMPGVDPLWMLNHVHFLDSGRDNRRPITFSRYAGPGSHRYPVGFSGDTVISWASLQFQPEFTATAANIGYGWWSHDIGGHLHGVRDDELATRWVQLGTFSPINRLHSSNNPFLIKEPWMYPEGARQSMDEALRFRHRLVPYLHTMNHRAAEGTPLVRPMYHEHPEADDAYRVPNQFLFGDSLVVAPITTPADRVTLRGSVRVWMPDGIWADLFTGSVYDARGAQGGRHIELHRDRRSIPVLLRAGSPLPLAAEEGHLDVTVNPAHLELLLLPGADGERELVEDDGTGSTREEIATVRTPLRWDQQGGALRIGPAAGATSAIPDQRTWTLTLLGVDQVGEVAILGTAASPLVRIDGDRTSITIPDVPVTAELTIVLRGLSQPTTQRRHERLFQTLNQAQWEYEGKAEAWSVIDSDDEVGVKIASLQALKLPDPLLSALTEVLVSA